MFLQRQTGTGIFACNGHLGCLAVRKAPSRYDVYSPQSIDINGYKSLVGKPGRTCDLWT